jgi:hypothetical protein
LEWYRVIWGKEMTSKSLSYWYPNALTTDAKKRSDWDAGDGSWEKKGRVWRLVWVSRRYVIDASRDAEYAHDSSFGCCNWDTRMELVKDELTRSLVNGTSANLSNVCRVRGFSSKNPKKAKEVWV